MVITGADNIYRMDFSQMLDHHIASGLPLTVASIHQPKSLADQFGVIEMLAPLAHRMKYETAGVGV